MTSNQPTSTDLQQLLEPLADDLANALADRDKAATRAEEIKAEMRALLADAGPGDYAAGMHTVKAGVTRTINSSRVAADYPANIHPYLYELKPDTKKVRAHLDEQQLEQYLDTSDLRITLGKGTR